MKRMQKGDGIDLLGPGGNFYKIDPAAEGIAVIGRGVGIASIVSLAERAKKEGRHVTAVLSAKTESLIFADDFLERIGCDVHVLSDERGTSDVENVERILTESIEKQSEAVILMRFQTNHRLTENGKAVPSLLLSLRRT